MTPYSLYIPGPVRLWSKVVPLGTQPRSFLYTIILCYRLRSNKVNSLILLDKCKMHIEFFHSTEQNPNYDYQC